MPGSWYAMARKGLKAIAYLIMQGERTMYLISFSELDLENEETLRFDMRESGFEVR